ncbi:DNA polymerase III subunit alpha [Peijinzhouia sedimentorum]
MYLNCHTWFSLMYGTLSPANLFEEAKKNGVRKLILTDIHNTSAWPELLRICNERREEYDLQIALGIEFRQENQLLYIGLARNNNGFEQLCHFLSQHNICGEPIPHHAPILEDVWFMYPFKRMHQNLNEQEIIGIKPSDVKYLKSHIDPACLHKCVIWQPVNFADKLSFNTHRLLRAIDLNVLLSKLPPPAQAMPDECMIPISELLKHYWQYPEIISNTQIILDDCEFSIEFDSNKNKTIFGKSKKDDHQKLIKLALEGFTWRYQKYNAYGMQRLLRELDVIAERNFEAYFLITHDIVSFAHHKNFAHVGRGSGANSMVAYCIGITEVDPIELDLYFERFLNPHRSSPPDFDIDFSWQDRDVVTGYILDKYGLKHAALLATHTTFQERSVVRELSKVFGLPKCEIDALVERPEQLATQDHISKLIWRYAQRLHDMPRHLSIHAGGIVITEKSLHQYTATDLPPKGFPITHFDMYGAEDIGIHKFDILSQRGLGHIHDTVEMVKKNKGIDIDITRTSEFKTDNKVRQLLESGRTMGAFYVESPAMRQLLAKLRCSDYTTLVAASSIIRPGVARSGMMREYIHRHLNPNAYSYIHPKMQELMKETYGIMVYQEDVIKVAHYFAGLDLAEADILRRGMSGKFRSRAEFKRVEKSYFDNCQKLGYPAEIYNEVWRQIESFSGYSFSKAHSASYAAESYQSLYLKAYFPLEFIVAVINNFGGFYRTEFYVHEARMAGAEIKAPCINQSEYLTSLHEKELYLGFIHVKSLEEKLGQLIPKEREENGPYAGLHDFLARIPSKLEQTCILIRLGAFRSTGISKRELMWQAHLYFGKGRKAQAGQGLFKSTKTKRFELPQLEPYPLQDPFDELELLGFPLCNPFDLLKTKDFGDTFAEGLMQKLGKQIQIVGYLVTTKNTRTIKGDLMHFGCFTDAKGHVFDSTHFPNTTKKYPFRGLGFYKLIGKVVEDYGYPMLEVSEMEKLPMISPME